MNSIYFNILFLELVHISLAGCFEIISELFVAVILQARASLGGRLFLLRRATLVRLAKEIQVYEDFFPLL